MKDYSLTGWQDYWKIFDELIELLRDDNKTEIIDAFKDAQEYVNGLTDGWFDFKNSFEQTLNSNRQSMTEEQIQIAKFLLATINKSLSNR